MDILSALGFIPIYVPYIFSNQCQILLAIQSLKYRARVFVIFTCDVT